MRREDVDQSEGHGFSSPLDSRQGSECGSGFFLTHFSKVQINHGGFEAAVSKIGGDLSNAGSGF